MTESQSNRESRRSDPKLDIAASAASEGSLYKAGFIDPPSRLGQMGKVDQYELLQELGRGGMAIVYLAQIVETGERVALKTLAPVDFGVREVAAQFIREVQAVEHLYHAHIVRILDVSRRPERPYFVMPYYPRGSLARMIGEQGVLPVANVVRLGLQIASALQRAHQSNVMHGDIKPSNILLQDDGLNISLADFGLARSFSTNIGAGDVRERVRRGTVHYMSPQMVKGEGEGLASDIYMFGATLYELLTGRPPYDGESVAEVCRKICEGPPTPIFELRPDVPTQLAKIIEKAMDRDDEHRYRTMKTIIRHLNELDEVEGRSFWCRLRSKAHLGRRRGVILPLVLAVTALVTTLGLWSASRRPGTEATQGLQPIQQIQIPGVRAWLSSLAGDWDGDGQEDLYIMRDNVLTMVSTDGEVLSEYRMDVPPQVRTLLYMVGDADGDRRDEAFPSWSLDGHMFIGMVTQSRFGLMRFEANGTVLEDAMGVKHTTSLVAVGLHDLDGDGNPELLAKLAAGFQMKPRGLCCFSLSSPEPIWTYLTASTVESVAVGDVSGDGKPEIAIGTFAPANGASLADGTDDAHAYVILLNQRGDAVWHQELGDQFCRARVELAELGSGEPPAILVGLTASREFRPVEGELGKILQFDKAGQMVHSYDLGTELHDFRAVRLEQDGPLQIIATDRLGCVNVLNSDLSLRRQVRLPRQTDSDMATQVQAVDDLDGDGRCEVIVTAYELENRASQVSGEGRVTFTHNHTIYVLNPDLTIRARYLLSESRKSFPGIRVMTSDVDRDGCKELIVLTDQATVLRLTG